MISHKANILYKRNRLRLAVPLFLFISFIPSATFAAPAVESGAGHETAEPDEKGSIDYTDPRFLQEMIESESEEYILVDVRTEEEYNSGYIPTAKNIPVQEIERTKPTDDKDALIILYCRSGSRSGRALDILEDQGFTNAHNFGGIGKWPGEVKKE
jgi:rhodanese-related sulfurtransferase